MKKHLSEFGESPTMGNAEPTPSAEDVAWLAGIFDGEGCIILNKMKKRSLPYIGFHITNTNLALLSKCQMILQVVLGRPTKLYERRFKNPKLNANYRCYAIDFRAYKDVYKVLSLIHPHLTAKKPKTTMVLRYLKHRIPEMDRLGKCNPFGISTETHRIANLITSNWSGVTTEREALQIFGDEATV